MLTRTTDYVLRLKFGDVEASIDPHALREFSVTQDISTFLPSFVLKTIDRQGLLTHIVPFDRRVSKMFVQFGKQEDIQNGEDHNYFNFVAYRKYPDSDGIFHVEGLLDVDGLFYPKRQVGRSGTIQSIIENISTNELKLKNTDISPSLGTSLTTVQGNWSNAEFLNYLKEWSVGVNNESCYFCFIRVRKGKKEFVFRSLNDFVGLEPINNFAFFREKVEDYYPIHEYRMIDTLTSFHIGGYAKQPYAYFDYFNGKFVTNELDVQDYYSLTEKFLIDGNRSDQDMSQISDIGRNEDYDKTRIGYVKDKYYRSLTALSKMWITTGGMQNICPGDIVLVAFPGPTVDGKVLDYQYSGFWLVEKIVHSFGSSYISKLLLTRNGVDSTIQSTLIPASRKKTRSRNLPVGKTFTTPKTIIRSSRRSPVGEDAEQLVAQ
jgi:hypothetical protein